MASVALEAFREAVLARAFQIVPGEHYNQVRGQFLEPGKTSRLIYELTLPEQGRWEEWRDKTFPLMARYLKSKGVDLEFPERLLITAFYGDRCYFIEGTSFWEAFKELEKLNSTELHCRLLQWLGS